MGPPHIQGRTPVPLYPMVLKEEIWIVPLMRNFFKKTDN